MHQTCLLGGLHLQGVQMLRRSGRFVVCTLGWVMVYGSGGLGTDSTSHCCRVLRSWIFKTSCPILSPGPWAKRAPAWQRQRLARETLANGLGCPDFRQIRTPRIASHRMAEWKHVETLSESARWWDPWTGTQPSVSILTLPTSRCHRGVSWSPFLVV